MKHLFSILFIIMNIYSYAQNNEYLNDDGTLSNHAKRELFVATLNDQIKESDFELDDKNLIVITSDNSKEIQTKDSDLIIITFYNCMNQLKIQLNAFKNSLKTLKDCGFENIIFKTNVVYPLETRRYYFKFSLNEINNFPNFVDIKEIFDYLKNNQNKNIILVKNP